MVRAIEILILGMLIWASMYNNRFIWVFVFFYVGLIILEIIEKKNK